MSILNEEVEITAEERSAHDDTAEERAPLRLIREAGFPRWAKVLAVAGAFFVAHSLLEILRMLFPGGW